MISWLVHWRMGKCSDKDAITQRYAIGRLLGWAGIVLNFFLFLSKFLIGILVGSVAIRGDAINNLTDSMSNIVSILSFKIAEKPADKEHPFGHERTETIAALFMGMVIVYLGIDMVSQSFEKILHPTPVDFQWSAVAVLVLSICIKLYMYSYNHKYSKVYDSELLEANAIDARNDMLGTSLVLFSTIISPLIGFDLDGYVGLVVSVIIFISAYGLIRSVSNSLLGEAPSPQMMNEMVDLIMRNPVVIDVHDIAIHSYGPRYTYATAHVEVDGTLSLMEAHTEVDRIEREVMKQMGIELVTHVDPVLLHDEDTIKSEDALRKAINACNEKWMIQDFRVETSPEGSKVFFFDLIVPYDEERSHDEIVALLRSKLHLDLDCPFYLETRLVHPYS